MKNLWNGLEVLVYWFGAVLLLVLSACASNYGSSQDKTEQWEQVGAKLITNAHVYNLDILEDPDDAEYPYKGWFFGWASDQCNTGYSGCDAIFFGRSNAFEGPWEVYAGEVDGGPIWDRAMDPNLWVPVISGGASNFDNWHNGDPSVVREDGRYYMLYSATGHNVDGIPFGQSGDTDSDISTVMAAVSEDGIGWIKSPVPVLLYEPNIGQSPMEPGGYMHANGLYHRPSLMIEDGKFKVWFDSYDGLNYNMLYAENSGDFFNPNHWQIIRGMDDVALVNFPNADVIKMGELYFAFGDPVHIEGPETGWAARKLTWAVSATGLDWRVVGYMDADPGWQANQVPQALVVGDLIYLTYAVQIPGDYRYESIRMKRWQLSSDEIERLRDYAQ